MSNGVTHICTFSGPISDLRKQDRTTENVLAILRENPRLSSFEISESPWLWPILDRLQKSGKVVRTDAGFPWNRYEVQP